MSTNTGLNVLTDTEKAKLYCSYYLDLFSSHLGLKTICCFTIIVGETGGSDYWRYIHTVYCTMKSGINLNSDLLEGGKR